MQGNISFPVLFLTNKTLFPKFLCHFNFFLFSFFWSFLFYCISTFSPTLSALAGLAVHTMPSAFGSHLFPPVAKFFGFDPGAAAAGLSRTSPVDRGLSLGQSLSVWEGYIHWLVPTGAAWPGHLEWCGETAAPCWCFCSCCLTCWMISRIFLCAVCRMKQGLVRMTHVQNVKQNALYESMSISVESWKWSRPKLGWE